MAGAGKGGAPGTLPIGGRMLRPSVLRGREYAASTRRETLLMPNKNTPKNEFV